MTLYDKLITLCETNEGFYFKDTRYIDNHTYRVFSYRLVQYADFMKYEAALESRGIMFRMAEVPELVCRPMAKFFNAHESNIDHDWSNPKSIMTKVDGSLISTFIDADNNLGVKSKTSLYSEHAIAAMNIIENDSQLQELLFKITKDNNTVNMEYVSPVHRIVLSYDVPKLIILNIRNNETGEYIDFDKYSVPDEYRVEHITVDDPVQFVDSVPVMTGIEGFVILKNNGEWVKLKTLEYLTLHKSKDAVNNPKALYECVLEEKTDDLRELFIDDTTVLNLISKMEAKVVPIYNHLVVTSEHFYDSNKHLERKDYAILANSKLSKTEFSIAMGLYSGKPVDPKELLKKKWTEYKDEIIAEVYGAGYNPDEE